MNTTRFTATLVRDLIVSVVAVLLISAPAAHADPPSAAREWNEQLLAAIRRNVPNPPAHARNLHHLAVAMYDAWAAYDTTAIGYIYNEKISPLPPDIEAARHEAISYAAYKVLRARFATPEPPPPVFPNPPSSAYVTFVSINTKLADLGYSVATAQAAGTGAATPSELGKRIAEAILAWGNGDGFSQSTYPQTYNTTVNPNMSTVLAMSVTGNNGDPDYFPDGRPNMQLGVGLPAGTDPNFWQPLALSASVTQNGIPTPGGIQGYVGLSGLASTPFSLFRTDPLKPWIDPGLPSRLSVPGFPSASDLAYKENAMDVLRKSARLNDDTVSDFSPATYGNNTLGFENNAGYAVNPVTGLPYAPNPVKVGDFYRVLAEFWADGPNSETPPGHWHVLANEVSDHPLTVKRIRGTGPIVNALEWDVKTYFSLSAATHDAACAAWSIKRYYSGTRPITMIRYMGTRGQSTRSDLPSHHTQGLPFETDVVEVITSNGVDGTADPGGKHETIWNIFTQEEDSGLSHLGEIVVKSWGGEDPENDPAPSIATHLSPVRWILAKDWLPFQRKTFNTPAFPGYTSGHSTFSRAAAEALTLLTGSPNFPGGFGHHTVAAHSMQIDYGPSAAVDLQWTTYYDAADQAGQSRRWGGIHPVEDDLPARIVGSQVGKSAFALAEKFWTGAIANEAMIPQVTVLPGGNVQVSWRAVRGMKHKVQVSTDLTNPLGWTDAPAAPGAPYYYAPSSPSYVNGAVDNNATYTDTSPGTGKKFYRIVRATSP